MEWQVRVLGTALAGLSQSEKQFEGIMRFIEGASLLSSDRSKQPLSEDDLEAVMSGQFAERTAKAAPTAKVASLFGHGFMGSGPDE